MALDPHSDREPGMDARVVVEEFLPSDAFPDSKGMPVRREFAKGTDGRWHGLTPSMGNYTWAQLAIDYPDAEVVLP